MLGLFGESKALTFGVELELQLINLNDFNLIASSPDLMYLLGQKKFPGEFTAEVTEGMIEICTSVHNKYAEGLAQLQEMRDTLVSACDKLNIGICGGGTHPFQKWSEQKIFPKERYQDQSQLYGYLTKQFTVFGQHIHIGCESGDNALYLLHALNRYIPHFIALSASSPFIQGADTLFNSARLNSVFAFPLSGRAPFLLKWKEFDDKFFTKMASTGIIKSMKDFYWDVRPKPEFGTIELRVCDTPLTVEKAAALAAYMQALCYYLLEHNEPDPHDDDYLIYNYNRFQACRFGFEGSIVHPKSYETVLIGEDIAATIIKLMPYAEKLECVAGLEFLLQSLTEKNDANILRAEYGSGGSVEVMVEKAMSVFRK